GQQPQRSIAATAWQHGIVFNAANRVAAARCATRVHVERSNYSSVHGRWRARGSRDALRRAHRIPAACTASGAAARGSWRCCKQQQPQRMHGGRGGSCSSGCGALSRSRFASDDTMAVHHVEAAAAQAARVLAARRAVFLHSGQQRIWRTAAAGRAR
ncbi:hypothetical protein Dimus_002923, partial [Dionaea muscipula]